MNNEPTLQFLKLDSLGFELVIYPIFAPIWNNEGKVIAFEILSLVKVFETNVTINSDFFFKNLDKKNQKKILLWQLSIIEELMAWLRINKLSLTLNINRKMADIIISTESIRNKISGLSAILRIEVSETFIVSDIHLSDDILLKKLTDIIPVWLDDFGCGSTSLRWLTECKIEAIKIDKNLVWKLRDTKSGMQFLHALTLLASELLTLVVIEGVADKHTLAFAESVGAYAYQGWIWPEISKDELFGFPLVLHDNT